MSGDLQYERLCELKEKQDCVWLSKEEALDVSGLILHLKALSPHSEAIDRCNKNWDNIMSQVLKQLEE